MKKAFTLSEMLICIAIMAALVVLFLSTIKAKPNSGMVMFRKAYNITSNNVYEILQSAAYYENGLLDNLNPTDQKIENTRPSGTTKFCKVFVSYINTIGDVKCDNNKEVPSFVTTDGITWWLPPKTTSGNFANKEIIKIDVNGVDNLPNCKDGDADCKDPDIFEIKVANTGKLYIEGDMAKQYLQNTKKISK